MRLSMSAAGMPLRSSDSRTTAPPRTVASVSTRVPLKEVPMAVRQAETMTASGIRWSSLEACRATEAGFWAGHMLPARPWRQPSGGRAQVRSDLVKIILSADRCTGHGRCYSLAPELFDSDDEGHSVLIASEVP